MKCPRCLNSDEQYFYKGSKGWYCRKCISFKRVLIEEEINAVPVETVKDDADEYLLKYPLTTYQKEISKQCTELIDAYDVCIVAVCGAGKTELVVETIAKMLKRHKKVCFAIARRQVVLELRNRLQSIFTKAKVVAVCQGFTSDLDGDIVVCTTHQCYRYHQVFDCLILDEPDAFPYKGNTTLAGIVKTSCKGHMIYLTATPDNYLLTRIKENDLKLLTLSYRPHGKPVPCPFALVAPSLVLLIVLIRWIIKHLNHQLLIFVPTIKQSKYLKLFMSLFFVCECCSSKTINRDEIIDKFRKCKIQILIATTILERGVTIEGIDVVVYNADSKVFDEASLIQMSGRVGRSYVNPTGDCLFLCKSQSKSVKQCIQTIKRSNDGEMLVL